MRRTMNNHETMRCIATDSLRACYVEGKVVASPTHFSDFWARDTFWAVPGMLAAGDHVEVRNCLSFFLSYQRKDGKLPRKISTDLNGIKYLFGKKFMRKEPRPIYQGLVWPFNAIDGELLFVIAVEAYVRETGDANFVEKHYHDIRKALVWYTKRRKNNLIYEHLLGNWMDTVIKFGPVLYTNALYARALGAMAEIAHAVGRDEDIALFKAHHNNTAKEIRKRFWNGSFFVDETRVPKAKIFDVVGNVQCLLYGIADDTMSTSVLAELKKHIKEHGVFLPAVPTGHRPWKINPVARLMGIGDYHTGASWLWIDLLVVRAFLERDEKEIADQMIKGIAEAIMRDGEVGETYFQDSTPYKKRFWESASPFAWSSGILLEILDLSDADRVTE